MKNLLVVIVLVLSVLGTNAQETKKSRKEKRAEREAKLVEQTKKLVAANAWQFNATNMLPAKGSSRNLTTSYSVVLENEEVDSYLPFIGVAYSASYGGTESPMIFKAPIEKYSLEDGKKGGYVIKFTAKNKNDIINYTFNVSSNGSTTLSVNSTNRQHISYHGNLAEIDKKDDK